MTQDQMTRDGASALECIFPHPWSLLLFHSRLNLQNSCVLLVLVRSLLLCDNSVKTLLWPYSLPPSDRVAR